MTVICPGCGEVHDLAPAVQVGAVVTCTWCAGVLFRLELHDGASVLREVPQASCPRCETLLPLPDTVQPGDTFRHCQGTFVVSYAHGAYALEPES
jgi:hypothetical protein